MGVVMASKGYPGSYAKGFVIEGLDTVPGRVYHMGTKVEDGAVKTAGGRVLMVVCKADTIEEAKEAVYADVAKIECDNLFYRNDIAHWALNK